MKRIIVIGSPGAGKSTFARQLRDITGLPLYYLDMIWHLPDRTTITKEDLQWIIQKKNCIAVFETHLYRSSIITIYNPGIRL